MDRETALAALTSPHPSRRIDAARYLVRAAIPEDIPSLVEALESETIAWARSALAQAIARLRQPIDEAPLESDAPSTDAPIDGETAAVIGVTSELLHELEPLIGVLRLRLITEWAEFDQSDSRLALDQIEGFLTALRDLNVAARVPTMEEFPLRSAMEDLLREKLQRTSIPITTTGPDIQVWSNKALLQLIVRNGIRNAIEATAPASGQRIVITWGHGPADSFFVSVVDQGLGPPTGAQLYAFEVGTSTKRGHLGMGLAIARRAADSLGGDLTLRPGKSGGAVLRFQTVRAGSS